MTDISRPDDVNGWRAAPVEPTDAMLDEGCLVDIEVYPNNIPSGLTALNHAEARAIWSAMLAAAPTPLQPDQSGGAGEVE